MVALVGNLTKKPNVDRPYNTEVREDILWGLATILFKHEHFCSIDSTHPQKHNSKSIAIVLVKAVFHFTSILTLTTGPVHCTVNCAQPCFEISSSFPEQ